MPRPVVAALLSILPLTAAAEIIDIDSARLAELAAKGVPVIDLRTEGEWRDTGIIAGSRLLTLFNERGEADPAAWVARLQGVASADKPLILICRSGNRTRIAARLLAEQAGYRTVYNVSNGIRAWMREGRPLAPAAPALARCGNAPVC